MNDRHLFKKAVKETHDVPKPCIKLSGQRDGHDWTRYEKPIPIGQHYVFHKAQRFYGPYEDWNELVIDYRYVKYRECWKCKCVQALKGEFWRNIGSFEKII